MIIFIFIKVHNMQIHICISRYFHNKLYELVILVLCLTERGRIIIRYRFHYGRTHTLICTIHMLIPKGNDSDPLVKEKKMVLVVPDTQYISKYFWTLTRHQQQRDLLKTFLNCVVASCYENR